MDQNKGLQNDVFSKFLNPISSTSPFGSNRSGERAYRRAERIIAAIFLLTNHLPADEPLKMQSRQSAMTLLPQILSIRNEMRSGISENVAEVQATIRFLSSLLKMMVFGGFASPHNAEVTITALDELGTFIALSPRSTLSDTVQLSKDDFFDVREYYKGHIKDIRDKQTEKDKQSIKDSPSSEGIGSQTLSARANGIVGILKTGGELNMRDIANQLPELSEKTIQRELTALIRHGVVKRSGLRRWSRYSLNAVAE